MKDDSGRLKDKLQSLTRQISVTITSRRRAMWLNQKQLAEKMGIRQSVVASLESAHANPTLATLVKFADFFDMRVTDLFMYSYPGIRRIKETEADNDEVPVEVLIVKTPRREGRWIY